jgi:hypothetical protein
LIRSEGNELTEGVCGDGPIRTKRMGCFDGFKSSVLSKKARISLSWACINGRFFFLKGKLLALYLIDSKVTSFIKKVKYKSRKITTP